MASHVDTVRRFNRFYTQQIGVLQEAILQSPFSLTEARIVYEVAHRSETTATELAAHLGLDAGYVSRIVRALRDDRLLAQVPSPDDRRRQILSLTPEGRRAFAAIDDASRREIETMLGRLSDSELRRLTEAMGAIERLLGPATGPPVPYVLRPPHAGDWGWVIQRHGVLYGREYGWDERFEALVARIVADFVDGHDTRRERCWIAEREGENVGSVFLVREPDSPDVARLRLLLVDPAARGLGIGRRLVQECARFARSAGYRRIVLWTNSVLVSARRIYEAEGYRLVRERPHKSFGADLLGQDWELEL